MLPESIVIHGLDADLCRNTFQDHVSGGCIQENTIIVFHYMDYSLLGLKSTLSYGHVLRIFDTNRALTSYRHHLHAVRRPCRLMLHGLLRVFPVLRRPGRALTISITNKTAGYRLSIINRGATPMLTSSHGLLRVFPVLRRPGRARTLAGRTRLRLRLRRTRPLRKR